MIGAAQRFAYPQECGHAAKTALSRNNSASTPMCAFMPKCRSLPLLFGFIAGSRTHDSQLVDLGAEIGVASAAVPALKRRALI